MLRTSSPAAAKLSVPVLETPPPGFETLAENRRIDHLFGGEKPLVSFEFFPPKSDEGHAQLLRTIEELRPMQPSYVSMTYGAGGSSRDRTFDLALQIQNDVRLRAMSHLTCVDQTREEIGEYVDKLWDGGVRNILALRGDPPAGQRDFTAVEGGFGHPDDLVHFLAERHPFCLGVAGYPEGHPQCLNLTRDIEYLKKKVDAGAHFVVTQLFFDNADFYRWRDRVYGMGVSVPLVAGIMPIVNVAQIKRFVMMCGAKIPQSLLMRLESLESDPLAVAAAGVEHAIRQCQDLARNDVDGVHFYTLNKSKATVLICQALGHGAA